MAGMAWGAHACGAAGGALACGAAGGPLGACLGGVRAYRLAGAGGGGVRGGGLEAAPLPAARLLKLPLAREADRALLLGVLVLADLLATALVRLAGRTGHTSPMIGVLGGVALAAEGGALAAAFAGSPAVERGASAAAAGLCACGALAALRSPSARLGLEAAATDLGVSARAWLDRKGLLEELGDVVAGLGPEQLQRALVLPAGLLGGALLGPALRAARSYSLATARVPLGPKKFDPPRGLELLRLHAGVVAPLFAVMAWLAALWPDAASGPAGGLGAGALAWAWVTAAALQVFAVRPLVQSFLDSSLVDWYAMADGRAGGAGSAGGAQQPEVLQFEARLRRSTGLLGKVAAQFLLLPLVLLTCGALLFSNSAPAAPIPGSRGLLPDSLVAAGVAFLGGWAAACWQAAFCAFLLLMRAGYLR